VRSLHPENKAGRHTLSHFYSYPVGSLQDTVMNKTDFWNITVFFSVCLDRFSLAADIAEGYKGSRKYDLLPEVKSSDDVEKGVASVAEATTGSTPQPHDKPRELS